MQRAPRARLAEDRPPTLHPAQREPHRLEQAGHRRTIVARGAGASTGGCATSGLTSRRLAPGALVLDGATGTELERRGVRAEPLGLRTRCRGAQVVERSTATTPPAPGLV
jgi:hypothetical protein